MSFTMKFAFKWGVMIGLANLIWLYLSYYAGLHTNGIVVFQMVPLGWLFITTAGYILALRELKRRQCAQLSWDVVDTPVGPVYQLHSSAPPKFGYWTGVRTGLLIAVITAVIAVLMQIGYYKVINPAWPEYMTQQTREYFSAQGLPQAQIEEQVTQARQTFSLKSYATQSSVIALLAGIVLSAIIMIFLRHKDGKFVEEQT